jgi:hypothetical protein
MVALISARHLEIIWNFIFELKELILSAKRSGILPLGHAN